MKKLLVFILLAAAVYPYLSSYYRESYGSKMGSDYENLDDVVRDLNSSFPHQQGLLTYTEAVVATGSIIIIVTDNFAGSGDIAKTDAQDRMNTWAPFLIDKTCRDKILSNVLKNELASNIYYQFKTANGHINYGKIVVAPEMCW